MNDEITDGTITILPASIPSDGGTLPPIPEKDREKLPGLIARAGERAAWRFLEFFLANIHNDNTREAYGRAVVQFFHWCDERRLELHQLNPIVVAAYIRQMGQKSDNREPAAPQTIKQHLAAIRMLFDWLVIGQVVPANPAASVRGPKYVTKKGKTPVLSAKDTRRLLDSIDTSNVVGLRDRALVALMVYSFARVSAVVNMRVEDYYQNGKRWWIRLHEKGGKYHEVPVHHNAEEYLDAYIEAAGISKERKTPLFRSAVGKTKRLSERGMDRTDALRMIKRRAVAAGLPGDTCCHTFRGTGITTFLENGGSVEHAQQIAAHESPRTTKLYDRRHDEITLDEIERIII